jgi:hypothetical protein
MKIRIDKDEIKSILEMHYNEKKGKSTIVEQTKPTVVPADPNLTKLREAIKAGCLTNGKLQRKKSTGQIFYRRPSTKTPTLTVDFFGDMTYKLSDGSKNGQWQCPEIAAQAAAAQAQAAASQAQALAADEKAKKDKVNIGLTQQEGGWKKREDITDTDANVNNPQMYEQRVVNGVTLYRRVSGKGITGTLDERQKAVVDKWIAQGAKLEKDLDAEQAQTWTKKVVSPKSDGLFSEDLIMYFPPNTVNNASIDTAFQAAVADQTPQSKSDCKGAIEAYYMAYKTKKKIEPNTLNAMKEKVQACANQFDGKWGIGAFTKIDDYVDILRGVRPGGPSSYGESSKWKLN